jgi:hypothetical protein
VIIALVRSGLQTLLLIEESIVGRADAVSSQYALKELLASNDAQPLTLQLLDGPLHSA